MISINVAIPISLHLLAIPITANSLALSHVLLAAFVGVIFIVFNRNQKKSDQNEKIYALLISSAFLFALLVLPLTHIAGIDTYKWQDLASNIAVEQRITWLIHPLSLLGFTPRSYSSAQPLVLASIQILGHTGVDWGFYLLSLAFGLTGFSGAWALGRYLFKSDTSANWLAILYIFSPVFMRYNYWATGRGLLLALLPVYLLILLKLGKSLTGREDHRLRSLLWLIPAWLLMTGLIMMSHKAGVIGAMLIPPLFVVSPALWLLRGRWGLWIVVLLALAVGLLLADKQPIMFTTRLITRFGWLLPLALLAIATVPDRFQTPPIRTLLVAGLGTLALSCTPDMYGALLALPFIACIATVGLEKIILNSRLRFSGAHGSTQRPRSIDGVSAEGGEENSSLRTLRASVQNYLGSNYIGLAVILIPALAIVLNQMRDSPSESVYQAAQFIEQHDPRGPFRIEAPGPARHQIQAYVSGCPRFTVHSDTVTQVGLHTPPPWSGHLAHDARHWIDYLRSVLELRGASTDWYGDGDKFYYITIDGQGTVPQNAKRLFASGNVAVFE